MDLGLAETRAIICAASKGLGRASALGLAREGARVAICARGDDALQQTAADIRAETGVDVIAEAVDLTDGAGANAFAARVMEAWGGVDILVNNAGGPPPGPFLAHDDDAWRAAFDLNFMSAVTLIRAVAPGMQERGWGRIINITSIAVKEPVDQLILSNAVRAGVTGLARTLANEFGPRGVTVNCVCPGFHLTDRMRGLCQGIADGLNISFDEAAAQFAERVPLGRIGDPQEFGDVVTFLASERASYVNGQSWIVDGGTVRALL